MLMTFRPMMAAGALIAFGALGFALVLQYAFEMEPCPMCIFQRVAMVGVGVVMLVAVGEVCVPGAAAKLRRRRCWPGW